MSLYLLAWVALCFSVFPSLCLCLPVSLSRIGSSNEPVSNCSVFFPTTINVHKSEAKLAGRRKKVVPVIDEDRLTAEPDISTGQVHNSHLKMNSLACNKLLYN